ncbi:hypothetical protein TNCV_3277371 [Trichonephila clavipes]|nr:hypothetical protein TNCV_3277371 [Trichonephila clavipes]
MQTKSWPLGLLSTNRSQMCLKQTMKGERCSFMRSKTVRHQRLKSDFASCLQCILECPSSLGSLPGEYTPAVLRQFRPGTLSRHDEAAMQDFGSESLTTLTRLRSGHTRDQRHVASLKVYPPCPNCNETQAAPAHILACFGCRKSQLLSHKSSYSFSMFKNARVHGLDLDVSVDQVG